MRPYATVVPTFWAAFRSRVVRECGPDAQAVLLLALYGITSPGSNMLGLYYLPLPTIAHETGLTLEQVSKGFDHLKRLEFCLYDSDRELIWVQKMARFQIGEALSAGDKRCAMVRKEITRLGENDFTRRFIGMYSASYHLKADAPSKALVCPPESAIDAPSKPLVCASEGASVSAIQEQEHYKTRDHDQDHALAPGGASTTSVIAPLVAERLVALWNNLCGKEIPKVKELTKGRRDKIRTRLNAKENFEQEFEAAVKRASVTPFLRGDNQRGWKADFDWMIANDTNYVAVLEGKYDAKPQANSGRSNGELTGAGARKNSGAYRSEEAGSAARFADRKPDIIF